MDINELDKISFMILKLFYSKKGSLSVSGLSQEIGLPISSVGEIFWVLLDRNLIARAKTYPDTDENIGIHEQFVITFIGRAYVEHVEEDKKNLRRAINHSRIALTISGLALIIAIASLVVQWWK